MSRGEQYFWNPTLKKWLSRDEMIKLRDSKNKEIIKEVPVKKGKDKVKFNADGKDGMELRWNKINFLKEQGEQVGRSTSNDDLNNLINTKYN